MGHPAYHAGETTTDFIEVNWPEGWNTETSDITPFVAAAAGAVWVVTQSSCR